MSKAHRPDDIEYVEYYLRKTIQPNSLRSPRDGNVQARQNSLNPQKNFIYFLNQQTALLRESQESKTSIRELYSKNQTSKDIILFPNFTTSPKSTPQHKKQISLDQKDPLIQKVMKELEYREAKDYIYAETPAANVKKTALKESKKELSVEKRIKFALLDKIDEKEMQRLYNQFTKASSLEKLRDFRKDGITKQLPMCTFYTAVPELENDLNANDEEKKTSNLLGHGSILTNFVKNKLNSTAEERDNKVIANILNKYNLSTQRLLNIDENIGNEQGKNYFKTEPEEQDYRSDDIEKAKEEIAQKARELKEYKDKAKFRINTDYHRESKKNFIGDRRTIQRLRDINYEFEKVKGVVSFKRKKTIIKELGHLQENRHEIIDTLKKNEKDQDKLREGYEEIPQINMDFLEKNLEKIDMINSGSHSPDTKQLPSSRKTVEIPSTANSNSPRKGHRRIFSTLEVPNRDSIYSQNSMRSPRGDGPSFAKSNSTARLFENSQSSHNKQLHENWNEFLNKVKMISEIHEEDSRYLHRRLPKFSNHVQKVYDKMEELQQAPIMGEKMDFSSFKDEKRFKNKLIEGMMSKIKNKDAFVNVLVNRNREKAEDAEVAQFLEYNFQIKPEEKEKKFKLLKKKTELPNKITRTPSIN